MWWPSAPRASRCGAWACAATSPLLYAVLLTFLLQMATIYVPWLNPIFQTAPLSLGELALCMGAALVVLVAVELEKAWRRSQPQRRTTRRAQRQRPGPACDLRVLWSRNNV